MKKSNKAYTLHKLVDDMSSTTYHSTEGTFSSSQFKDLIDDEEKFIRKYIAKTEERESIGAFDVGTYFHTAMLEPDKIDTDCAVYTGAQRRGNKWKKFEAKHKGKAILTYKQVEQAKSLVKAAKESPITMDYIERGRSEISLFVELMVWRGDIYAPHFGKMLTRDGWIDVGMELIRTVQKNANTQKFIIKVRADKLGDNYIFDLKSTTGNAKSPFTMRQKISAYNYDLSAALYLDLFSLMLPAVKSFIWGFASKDYLNCRSYKASADNIRVGRAKYIKGLLKMAEGQRNEWQTYDYLGELEPLPWEMEHIRERETDLL